MNIQVSKSEKPKGIRIIVPDICEFNLDSNELKTFCEAIYGLLLSEKDSVFEFGAQNIDCEIRVY
jgi:hypothetical protein